MPEPEAGSPAKNEDSNSSIAKPKSNLIPIAGGVVVFVACVVIFSLKFGVFSSSNIATPSGEEALKLKADSLAKVDSVLRADSVAADQGGYDGLFADFEDNRPGGINQEDSAANDSLAKAKWYEGQKAEIVQKMSQLEQEKSQLESLKGQVEALLQRKKSLEEGNVVQIAKLYEGMATEDLVPILANLSDAQVSVLISKMKKQKASEILGKLPPERAAKITQFIISMSSEEK